jgi:hypothetical protein
MGLFRLLLNPLCSLSKVTTLNKLKHHFFPAVGGKTE